MLADNVDAVIEVDTPRDTPHRRARAPRARSSTPRDDQTAWRLVVDEPDRWVLHIHGSYPRPDTVVFTEGSYAGLVAEPASQAHLRALALNHAFVFVVGGGVDDATLGGLREHLAAVSGRSGRRTTSCCPTPWRRPGACDGTA